MKCTKLLNVGFGNSVMIEKIIAIINPDSSAGRRIKEEAKKTNMLVDATQGRRCRAIIITNSTHTVLSSLSPDSLSARVEGKKD